MAIAGSRVALKHWHVQTSVAESHQVESFPDCRSAVNYIRLSDPHFKNGHVYWRHEIITFLHFSPMVNHADPCTPPHPPTPPGSTMVSLIKNCAESFLQMKVIKVSVLVSVCLKQQFHYFSAWPFWLKKR